MKRISLLILLTFVYILPAVKTPVVKAQTYPNWTSAMAWSPDGKSIAVGTQNGSVQVFSYERVVSQALQTNGAIVYSLTWSPDSSKLASGDNDPFINIWDTTSGKKLFSLQSIDYTYSVSWNPIDDRLASGSYNGAPKNTLIWDTSTGNLLTTIGVGDVRAVSWSPDGSKLAISVFGRIEIWNPSIPQKISAIKTPQDVVFLAWSPDSTELASADTYTPDSSAIRIWNVADGQLLHELKGHTDVIQSVEWSPDGMKLASASSDHTVRTWSTVTWQPIQVIQGSDSIYAVSWRPHSNLLAYGDLNGVIKTVWVQPTPDDLRAEVSECVSNHGVANSLNVKIDHGDWNPLINEVQAQTGKKIDTWCADQMIQIANYLIQNPSAIATLRQ